ncbi:unnamed protein product [Chrysoparadoxa australica]
MHNLFCDNCHSHVARALNTMRYKGWGRWNMIILCFWVLVMGSYTSRQAAVIQVGLHWFEQTAS